MTAEVPPEPARLTQDVAHAVTSCATLAAQSVPLLAGADDAMLDAALRAIDADNTWFTLLTLNTTQIHFNAKASADRGCA